MTQVDYDVHGLAGIRLVDANTGDADIVTRQIGALKSPLDRDPDIIIRFVDRLELSSPLRYLGVNEAGFTDDAFLVLRGRFKSRARVQIPFDRIGGRCEIVCERGLVQVPLLIPILNLTILGNGALPLHASAFTYQDTGFLATGWSKGGKTETLLAFMANGARYVGDEWVYLDGAGTRMYGIPEPIRVWSWHLDALPRYRRCLGMSRRARLRMLALAVGALDLVGPRDGRAVARLKSFLARQLHVDVPPGRLFAREACALEGVPDRVLFVASHESPELLVRPIDADEIACRMVHSLQEEQATLRSYYRKFRFAFPAASNEMIERSAEIQAELLKRALTGKEAHEVLHPYPVCLESLFRAIEGRCLRTTW